MDDEPMHGSIPTCGLCGVSIRECIRVPHYRSTGLQTQDSHFCTDCWASWQNTRENLDGGNEFGVQGMTCPDCNRSLGSDEDMQYMMTDPGLYTITLRFEGQHPPSRDFMVSIDTKTENIKQMLIWNEVIDGPLDNIDLVLEGESIERMYLCAPHNATIHVVRRQQQEPTFLLTVIRFNDHRRYDVTVTPSTTILGTKELLTLQTGIPVDHQRLLLRGEHLRDLDQEINTLGLQENDVVYLVPSLRGDIGEFTAPPFLIPVLPEEVLNRIIATQETTPGYVTDTAVFQHCADEDVPILSQATMDGLIQRLDETYHGDDSVDPDQKVTFVSPLALETLVSAEESRRLLERFGGHVDKIVLRRTRPTWGMSIPYHLDCAIRTLQVPLNRVDVDYSGGQTIFLFSDGTVKKPIRHQGSYTLHNNHVVHGVTPVRSGIRYGLFLLQLEKTEVPVGLL